MSRHHTDLEKQQILRCLVANNGDTQLTSIQTGVPVRTLRDWRMKYLPPEWRRQHFQGAFPLADGRQFPPLPANESQALRDIQRRLMEMVNRLSLSIDEVIDEAPLIQRAAALSQFIDRVIKISAQLPPDPQDYLIEDELDDDDEPTASMLTQ